MRSDGTSLRSWWVSTTLGIDTHAHDKVAGELGDKGREAHVDAADALVND